LLLTHHHPILCPRDVHRINFCLVVEGRIILYLAEMADVDFVRFVSLLSVRGSLAKVRGLEGLVEVRYLGPDPEDDSGMVASNTAMANLSTTAEGIPTLTE